MPSADYVYVGSELDTFKLARNWKQYWSSVLAPFVHGSVLEVGAGIGANIPYLINDRVTRYSGLEPDGRLVAQHAGFGHRIVTHRLTYTNASSRS